MFIDRVNFDFEFTLFGGKSKNLKLNREFEYIYFFCNEGDKVLCPYNKYQPDYLNYLSSLGIILPKMDCKGEIRDWWGTFEDFNLAQKLNSKLTSTGIGREKGLNPKGEIIVKSFQEISSHINSFDYAKWIMRNPFAMAGTGSFIFNKDELSIHQNLILNLLEKNQYILAPFFSRVMDLGFIFENGFSNVTWNLNSNVGRFKGGIVFRDLSTLEKFIFDNFKWDFGEILKTQNFIFEIYKKMGNKGILQIDSFLYREDEKFKFYPLVEVNARKSMGYFINKLNKYLPQYGVGMFLSFKSTDIKNAKNFNERIEILGDLLWSNSKKLGVIPLSPIEGKLASFFISATSLIDLDILKLKLWQKLGIPGRIFSPAFDFLPKMIRN